MTDDLSRLDQRLLSVSSSYMELAFATDGKESLVLRVPTFWDPIKSCWHGAIQTPKTLKIISATAKDSKELEHEFVRVLYAHLDDSQCEDKALQEEIFSMFAPAREW